MRSFTSQWVKVQKSVKDNSLLFKNRPIIRFGCMSVVLTEVVFVIKLLIKYHTNMKQIKLVLKKHVEKQFQRMALILINRLTVC